MAIQFGKLCCVILREHFGEVVQKVSNELQWGPSTLHLLVSATGLPVKTVSICKETNVSRVKRKFQ